MHISFCVHDKHINNIFKYTRDKLSLFINTIKYGQYSIIRSTVTIAWPKLHFNIIQEIVLYCLTNVTSHFVLYFGISDNIKI